MKQLRHLLHLILLLCLVVSVVVGCAEKDKGIEVDEEFLSEALGEDGTRKQVSREEILARRRAREQARRRAELQAAKRKAAEEARRREAEAAAGARAAKTRDPQYREIQTTCKRCSFYLDGGELDRALEQATKLVNIREKSPEAHVVLGIVQRKMEQHDKALSSFERAYELEPDNEWVVANLGRAYRRAGDFKKAEEVYIDHLSRYPKAKMVLYNMGVFQELYRGDKGKALVAFVRYLRSGGERKDEVNLWVTVLAQDLGVERPATPGWVSPEAPAAQEAGKEPAALAADEALADDGGEDVLTGGAAATADAAEAGAEPAETETAAATETAAEAGAETATAEAEAAAPVAEAAGGAATTTAGGAGAGAAAAGTAAPEPELPPVTLYPFEVAKGTVDPALLKQIDQIFTDILGLGVELTAAADIEAIEKKRGWSGKCTSAGCQIRVAFAAESDFLVHGEIAQSPKAWYVIVDIYNLKTKSKARLKLQATIAEGEEAFYAKLRSMAKAVGRRMSR